MPTQVQIRGTTQATQEARTLASRELDINTTDKRLAIHDGSTVGGTPHVNWVDEVNQTFIAAAGSGTDTITMTLAKAPAAYQAFQRFVFEAANTNTGSATLNVNSLGAKTIKKKDNNTGTIAVLVAGDIIQGGIYTVFYDGTDMILESIDSGGIQDVSQGDLNTSTGTFSQSTSSAFSVSYSSIDLTLSGVANHVTLPGGQYGFTLQSRCADANNRLSGWMLSNDSQSYIAGAMPFIYDSANVTASVLGQQRYITSSPPFDHGDGDTQGYLFLKLNKQADILSHYFADVPPWGYNGKTNIRCDYKCPITGKKYKRVQNKNSLKDIIEGKAKQKDVYEEITQSVKNADISEVPHPFGGKVGKDETIVLVDPMDERVGRLIAAQNSGEQDISDSIIKGLITADQDKVTRKGLDHLSVHRFKFK